MVMVVKCTVLMLHRSPRLWVMSRAPRACGKVVQLSLHVHEQTEQLYHVCLSIFLFFSVFLLYYTYQKFLESEFPVGLLAIK